MGALGGIREMLRGTMNPQQPSKPAPPARSGSYQPQPPGRPALRSLNDPPGDGGGER